MKGESRNGRWPMARARNCCWCPRTEFGTGTLMRFLNGSRCPWIWGKLLTSSECSYGCWYNDSYFPPVISINFTIVKYARPYRLVRKLFPLLILVCKGISLGSSIASLLFGIYGRCLAVSVSTPVGDGFLPEFTPGPPELVYFSNYVMGMVRHWNEDPETAFGI